MNTGIKALTQIGSLGQILGMILAIDCVAGAITIRANECTPGGGKAATVLTGKFMLEFTGGEDQRLGMTNQDQIRSGGRFIFEIENDFNQDAQKGHLGVLNPLAGGQADGDGIGTKPSNQGANNQVSQVSNEIEVHIRFLVVVLGIFIGFIFGPYVFDACSYLFDFKWGIGYDIKKIYSKCRNKANKS